MTDKKITKHRWKGVVFFPWRIYIKPNVDDNGNPKPDKDKLDDQIEQKKNKNSPIFYEGVQVSVEELQALSKMDLLVDLVKDLPDTEVVEVKNGGPAKRLTVLEVKADIAELKKKHALLLEKIATAKDKSLNSNIGTSLDEPVLETTEAEPAVVAVKAEEEEKVPPAAIYQGDIEEDESLLSNPLDNDPERENKHLLREERHRKLLKRFPIAVALFIGGFITTLYFTGTLNRAIDFALTHFVADSFFLALLCFMIAFWAKREGDNTEHSYKHDRNTAITPGYGMSIADQKTLKKIKFLSRLKTVLFVMTIICLVLGIILAFYDKIVSNFILVLFVLGVAMLLLSVPKKKAPIRFFLTGIGLGLIIFSFVKGKNFNSTKETKFIPITIEKHLDKAEAQKLIENSQNKEASLNSISERRMADTIATYEQRIQFVREEKDSLINQIQVSRDTLATWLRDSAAGLTVHYTALNENLIQDSINFESQIISLKKERDKYKQEKEDRQIINLPTALGILGLGFLFISYVWFTKSTVKRKVGSTIAAASACVILIMLLNIYPNFIMDWRLPWQKKGNEKGLAATDSLHDQKLIKNVADSVSKMAKDEYAKLQISVNEAKTEITDLKNQIQQKSVVDSLKKNLAVVTPSKGKGEKRTQSKGRGNQKSSAYQYIPYPTKIKYVRENDVYVPYPTKIVYVEVEEGE